MKIAFTFVPDIGSWRFWLNSLISEEKELILTVKRAEHPSWKTPKTGCLNV